MSDLQTDIAKQLHEAHAKYTYFILAAAASGIALCVQRTTDAELAWKHLLLGFAVLSWAGSFIAGCRNRAYHNTTLYANLTFLKLEDGTHPETPAHPQAQLAACEGVRHAAESNASSGNFFGHLQFRLLVLGAVFFLAWHIGLMAMRTSSTDNQRKVPNNEIQPTKK